MTVFPDAPWGTDDYYDDEDQCPDCGMVEYECVCEDDGFAEHDGDGAIKDALYEDGAR